MSHSEIHELKENIDEIRRKVATKQDVIRPAVWIPLAIWLLSSTIGGVYAFATSIEQLKALTQVVEVGLSDQYHASDARRDFLLRDQKQDFLQTQLQHVRATGERFESRLLNLASAVERCKLILTKHDSSGS